MTIGIDIRVLGKGKRTGVEDYTINLLSRLLPQNSLIKYKLFHNSFRKPDLTFDWMKLENVELKVWRIPNRIFDLFLRFLKFPKLDRILNPPKGKTGKIDIFLSPHFLLTPLSRGIKRIIIFYDLSFIRFPEFFSLPKLFWHKFMYSKKQAQKADLIIAISQSTKEDLINLYNIASEKIKVIYPGIDKKFKPIKKTDLNLERAKNKYKLPDSFILYFGTIEPRKNILAIIKAFEQIKENPFFKNEVKWQGLEGRVERGGKMIFDFSKLKLVIAGTRGWLYDEVFKTAKQSRYSKDIIFTDFIEEEDKVYLYNLADIFVYPSFFEGFGLPPLEAMASGLPVIVSNTSSLSEVVGKGAIVIDPYNIDEIAFAIKEILENKNLKEYLLKEGIKRAEKFDWHKTAKEFLKTFKV